jgi:hypothetical protein
VAAEQYALAEAFGCSCRRPVIEAVSLAMKVWLVPGRHLPIETFSPFRGASYRQVRAILRGLILTTDPTTLPAEAKSFVFGAQLLVGPADGPGEESFELTICSPEWLRQQCKSGEPVSGLHCVIVGWDTYDERALRQWLEARVQVVEAETWDAIAGQLRFLGKWEFDAYRR